MKKKDSEVGNVGRFVLLDEEGLNKSSKLKVLAVWVGCKGLVKLNKEGLRIPSRPSSVRGFGDEFAVFVWETFTVVAMPFCPTRSPRLVPPLLDDVSESYKN